MRFLAQSPGHQLRSAALRYQDQRFFRRSLSLSGDSRGLFQDSELAFVSVETGESRKTDDSPLARLEAILFLAREPLSTRRLSQYAGLTDGTEARTLIGQLNQKYDRKARAFRVEQVAGGYQLLTRAKFANWLRRLNHAPEELRLSAPSLETLAVVAYRQPVPRADVEAIRGVSCGEILRQLMERDLVRIDGRGDELGRPYLYATTKRFLQLFGLRSLDQLPRGDVLRNLAIPNKTQPVGTSPDQMIEQDFSPVDES